MGNKALSHDSVFIFESAPENTTGDMSSQENIPGKVKTLQVRARSVFTRLHNLLLVGCHAEHLLGSSLRLITQGLCQRVGK
uniref:Uncharacterized protein n=1 Tax=Chelonoidis abingdonii TaxID=106734 RepID=A0A8C0IX15_CHEAB